MLYASTPVELITLLYHFCAGYYSCYCFCPFSGPMGFFLGCFGCGNHRHRLQDHLNNDQDTGTRVGDNDQDYWSPAVTGLKRYRWQEIETMTQNFSQVIGVGGFSSVYLACLPAESTLAAVKVYHSSSLRLNQVFKSELDITSQLHHPGIVKLLGYCNDREEGVLVFEYIPHGTLEEKLHSSRNQEAVLPWKNRMAIVFQLAQALEYLHDECSHHIVHGDIKSSNILLDAHLNSKLCDFGSAKMGFSSAQRPMINNLSLMGSPGYTDPHYLTTGIASKKNDIYSLGVIILELITGAEAFCAENDQMLTSTMRVRRNGNFELEVNKVVQMAEQQLILAGLTDTEEATNMAYVAALCLHQLPGLRPSAADVCRIMREKISSIAFLFSTDAHKLEQNSLQFYATQP
ncbi:hypothetical protein Nepgr_010990 [Nepenthes gracilis]|uniref:Protein kinase domain-containing protein n=1 Tax=Nepenthes gracilis TaxID=150966 RepID=A0AAD3XLV6_NEPGR|nr:hypothetical protein Nepgr_010990 [Nepenthes gracilis]